ncbi:hypothetical protein MRX96_026315 [Rhipicephalus microplus]
MTRPQRWKTRGSPSGVGNTRRPLGTCLRRTTCARAVASSALAEREARAVAIATARAARWDTPAQPNERASRFLVAGCGDALGSPIIFRNARRAVSANNLATQQILRAAAPSSTLFCHFVSAAPSSTHLKDHVMGSVCGSRTPLFSARFSFILGSDKAIDDATRSQ